MKTELLKENDFFGTSDMTMHVTLRCYGYSTEAIDRSEVGKAMFYVKRNRELDELIRRYFAHELQVDPLEFAATQKEIKTQLYHA